MLSKTPRAARRVLMANMEVASQRCTHTLQLVRGRPGNHLGLLLFATRPVSLVPPGRGAHASGPAG